ncbi:regulatory protein [Deinococcus yavapaiensis KR-236]|uniref:Regulatory protein RecX n=2 Tax=Deinococcus TaxID=1298 RepID=A0A318SDI5_9DEIO|nr:regulatory protein [Deinococcus yavapaiensis KR-236]
MEYAFRALAARALTEHELLTRLAKRGASSDESRRVVDRLKELGYIDDEAVARGATTRRGVGKMRVKFDLARRGVDKNVIAEAVSARGDDEEREEAARLVERYRDKWLRAKDPRAKAFGFLARRGFAVSVIYEVIGNLHGSELADVAPDDP